MIRAWLRWLRDAHRELGEPLTSRVGSPDRWFRLVQSWARIPSSGAALDVLAKHAQPEDATSESAPVFVLSAGWRSGSTLLQRLVLSGKRTLI